MPTLCEENEEEAEEEDDSAVEDMRGSWGEGSDVEGWTGELQEPTEDTFNVDGLHLKMVLTYTCSGAPRPRLSLCPLFDRGCCQPVFELTCCQQHRKLYIFILSFIKSINAISRLLALLCNVLSPWLPMLMVADLS